VESDLPDVSGMLAAWRSIGNGGRGYIERQMGVMPGKDTQIRKYAYPVIQ
jgi:hypothetical protein